MIKGTATNAGWLSGLSKKVSQYIRAEPVDLTTGKFLVRSKYDFISLDFADISWDLTVDDKVLQKGILPKISLPPKQKQQLTIPFKKSGLKPGAENEISKVSV